MSTFTCCLCLGIFLLVTAVVTYNFWRATARMPPGTICATAVDGATAQGKRHGTSSQYCVSQVVHQRPNGLSSKKRKRQPCHSQPTSNRKNQCRKKDVRNRQVTRSRPID